MDEQLTTEKVPRHRRKRTKKIGMIQVILSILLIVIWLAGVYAGYWYLETKMAENYQQTKTLIDQSINAVQETNALRVQELEDRLAALNLDMEQIEEALANADDSLNESNETREELNSRIEQLDNQLEELRKSLEILKGN